MAHKIGVGATRNLVIRNITSEITDNRLREDLDHIHNLGIIYISFADGNAYLSLNSIHNALFAKSCMMSRAIYKGFRIDWYPDECAQPLPRPQKAQKTDSGVSAPKKPQPVNRFQMLMNEDGTEDNSDDQDVDDTTVTELSSLQLGHDTTWNSGTITA